LYLNAFFESCSSTGSIMTRLQTGCLGFDSWQGLWFFTLSTVSR